MIKNIYQSNLTENPPIIRINDVEFPNPNLHERIPAYRKQRLLRVMRNMPLGVHWWSYPIFMVYPDTSDNANPQTKALSFELFDDFKNRPISPYTITPYVLDSDWDETESEYKLQRQVMARTKKQLVKHDTSIRILITNEPIDESYLEMVLNFGSYVAYLFNRIHDKKLRL